MGDLKTFTELSAEQIQAGTRKMHPQEEIAALRGRVKELEAALKPFPDAGCPHCPAYDGDEWDCGD